MRGGEARRRQLGDCGRAERISPYRAGDIVEAQVKLTVRPGIDVENLEVPLPVEDDDEPDEYSIRREVEVVDTPVGERRGRRRDRGGPNFPQSVPRSKEEPE